MIGHALRNQTHLRCRRSSSFELILKGYNYTRVCKYSINISEIETQLASTEERIDESHDIRNWHFNIIC